MTADVKAKGPARLLIARWTPKWVKGALGAVLGSGVVLRLRQDSRQPLAWADLVLDYLVVRHRLRFLRSGRPREMADKQFAVFSVYDLVYGNKVLGMLSVSLQLEGYRGVGVLDARHDVWSRRFQKAFGITSHVYLEDYELTHAEAIKCERAADRFLAGDLDFQNVKSWTFEDSWIGPQILSTISRKNYMGAPDPADPAIRDQIRTMLPETLRRVILARKAIRDIGPSICLTREANYASYGPLVDASIAEGIDVIRVHQSWREDALNCKRLTRRTRRSHPASVSESTLKSMENQPWTADHERELAADMDARYGGKWILQKRNQPGTRAYSREEIFTALDLNPKKKLAVIFSHILWDANLFYGEDIFDDYGDWFVETVKAACANPKVNWVIKIHPVNLWKRAREGIAGDYSEVALIRQKVGPLPRHVKLMYPETEISTLSLLKATDYAITVRGTVGIEAAALGVLTLTAGTGRYANLGFTEDSTDRKEYLGKLSRIETFAAMPEDRKLMAKRHAYAAFLLRPWRMKSFQPSIHFKKKGWSHLDQTLVPTVSTLEQLVENGDLTAWSDWALRSGDEDYVSAVYKARHAA